MNVTKLKAGFAIATTVLGFAGTVVSGTLWISKRLSAIDERVTKIENAVKVLNTEQSDQYKEIINQLLAVKEEQESSFGFPFGHHAAASANQSKVPEPPALEKSK